MKTCADHASATAVAGSVSATAYNHPLLQVAPATAAPGCKCGKLRPPRKLHAAVGLWLALFVCVHFAICLTGITPLNYEGAVRLIHRLLANLPGAVLLLVIFPMLLQAGSGLYLAAKEGMAYDVKRCDRGGKLRYFLQRWSGLAMLAFLLLHVGSMRGWGLHQWGNSHPLGLDSNGAFAYTAAKFHPWSAPTADTLTVTLLLLGILGAVFHIANGAWSGAILWKAVLSPRSKIWFGYVCVGAGIALAAMGTIAWYAFSLSPNAQAALALTGR